MKPNSMSNLQPASESQDLISPNQRRVLILPNQRIHNLPSPQPQASGEEKKRNSNANRELTPEQRSQLGKKLQTSLSAPPPKETRRSALPLEFPSLKFLHFPFINSES